jgi:hypothetical protein
MTTRRQPGESMLDFASRVFTNNRRGARYWGACARISMMFKDSVGAGMRARIAARYATRLLSKRKTAKHLRWHTTTTKEIL